MVFRSLISVPGGQRRAAQSVLQNPQVSFVLTQNIEVSVVCR